MAWYWYIIIFIAIVAIIEAFKVRVKYSILIEYKILPHFNEFHFEYPDDCLIPVELYMDEYLTNGTVNRRIQRVDCKSTRLDYWEKEWIKMINNKVHGKVSY